MKTIWKFTLVLQAEVQRFTAPGLDRITHFDIQDGRYCFWAEVVQSDPERSISVAIVGIGNRIPEPWQHRGTVQDGGYVWHLYQCSDEGARS